jgi:uncharacterized membrane protein YdjX (TVP38/TMEM64 family)
MKHISFKKSIIPLSIIILIGITIYTQNSKLLDIQKTQNFIQSFGIYGPLVFILIYIFLFFRDLMQQYIIRKE